MWLNPLVRIATPALPDKTVLVPLTSSLYVPGKLNDTEHVIVDVGTGYYVKKVRSSLAPPSSVLRAMPARNAHRCRLPQTRAQATKHYETKVEYIRTNLEALQETIQKKRENMNYIIQALQIKLQQQAGGKEAKAG